jgi:hypothetical protein
MNAMKTSLLLACAVSSALATFVLPAAAQSGGGASQSPASVTAQPSSSDQPAVYASNRPTETIVQSPPIQGEPSVQHTVIEDKGSKIDELRVRGQVKRITVTPKQGFTKSYEILADDGTGFGDTVAAQTPHGNEGRRVWSVLSF